jgi:hypothetical protein
MAGVRRLVLVGLLFLAAPAFAGDLEVSADGGLVSVRARDVPASAVLERLRGQVNLIFDASVETRVTIALDRVEPAEAVRRVARAADLEVEEAPGPILLVRKRKRDAPPGPAIEERGGVFFAKGAFDYPVIVLRDRPEDVTEKAALSRFEATPGVSLVSAPDLKGRVLREYLEARDVYRAIGARAGVDLPLTADIDERHVRIYIAEPDGRYYAEILLDGDRQDLVHLVYRLEPERLHVRSLTLFRRPLDPK